jgi:8-oxo-dGTP pyrophosphatase MutT (NUDIX family)
LALLLGIADKFGIHQFELLADPDNVASRRVATRSGFTEVSERDGRVLYVAARAPVGSPRKVVDKVLVYVVAKERLLVFKQPEAPGGGRQVPGGSFEPGETAQEAALREAEEETGLCGFTGVRYLGSRLFESRTWTDLLFHRHFFLLEHAGTDVERWQRWERTPSTGGAPILFDFEWVPLAEVALDWEMDAFLGGL